MLLVPDFLEQSAARRPEKTALICGAERWSYAQLDLLANRLANALRAHGVARGDRVVLHLPNSVELVIGIFAVLKADATFVVINDSTKEEKLARIVADCGATTLVTQVRGAAVAERLLHASHCLKFAVLGSPASDGAAELPATCLDFRVLLDHSSADRPPRRSIDRDLACLIYTSGSTGESKGVMCTHANVVFAASSIITYLENTEDDTVLCALPLSFDYGLYQLLMVLKFGGTLVLERSFAFPGQFLNQLQRHRVTGLPGVPTMFSVLLQMDLSAFDMSALRYITNTAAALPVSHVLQLADTFPRASIYSMYGLTETKRTLYLPPEQLRGRPGSVGVAIPGTEVWLVDEHDQRLGPNQVGELVIRGGHVMCGYWNDAEKTAQRYRPGPVAGERVCYSGDLFRMDDEGYFYFVARKDDIIKSRGEKVAPKEVENVLHDLPGIAEAAVVGVPDALLGQAVTAFVVSDGRPLSERDVLLYCRARLEDFMVPKQVVFVDSLPRSANGKIDKSALTTPGAVR